MIAVATSPWLVVLAENDNTADCLMSLDVVVINSLFFFDLLALKERMDSPALEPALVDVLRRLLFFNLVILSSFWMEFVAVIILSDIFRWRVGKFFFFFFFFFFLLVLRSLLSGLLWQSLFVTNERSGCVSGGNLFVVGVRMIHSNGGGGGDGGGGGGGGGLAIAAAISPWLAIVLEKNNNAADCPMLLNVVVINSFFFFDLLALNERMDSPALEPALVDVSHRRLFFDLVILSSFWTEFVAVIILLDIFRRRVGKFFLFFFFFFFFFLLVLRSLSSGLLWQYLFVADERSGCVSGGNLFVMGVWMIHSNGGGGGDGGGGGGGLAIAAAISP